MLAFGKANEVEYPGAYSCNGSDPAAVYSLSRRRSISPE